jgi:hypothetical protein
MSSGKVAHAFFDLAVDGKNLDWSDSSIHIREYEVHCYASEERIIVPNIFQCNLPYQIRGFIEECYKEYLEKCLICEKTAECPNKKCIHASPHKERCECGRPDTCEHFSNIKCIPNKERQVK